MLLPAVLGILAGASTVIARMCNATLARRIGISQSAFYNYATGLLGSLLMLSLMGGLKTPAGPDGVFIWLGGVAGVGTVLLSNYITPRMSAYVLTLVLFVSQLAAGMGLDALAGVQISPGKLAGCVLVLLGLLYNQRVDNKKRAEESAG